MKSTWNGCIQILNICSTMRPPNPADCVDQFCSRFNHLSFTLQLQFNYMPYIFYYIQVQRLSWPGYSRNFIFNFPVSCKLWTVCRCIVIHAMEYKRLIPVLQQLDTNVHPKSAYVFGSQYYHQLVAEFLHLHRFCSSKMWLPDMWSRSIHTPN